MNPEAGDAGMNGPPLECLKVHCGWVSSLDAALTLTLTPGRGAMMWVSSSAQ